MGARIAWLDGWRGLAILFVLIGHFATTAMPALERLAPYGVEFFFVLSGRLMAEILFVRRHPLPDFFRRRFARIYPALLFYATAIMAAALAIHALTGSTKLRAWEYLSALTFTINYVQVFWQTSQVMAHIWSLSVEEHCYIILALLMLATSGRGVRWVLLALGILALLNGVRLDDIGATEEQIYWRTDVRLAPVFLAASCFLFVHDVNLKRWVGWLPLLFVPVTIALFFQPAFVVAYTASAILLAVSVNVLRASPRWLLGVLSSAPLTLFGLLSYSIYLWQQPFYAAVKIMGFNPIAGLMLALICGAGSYYLIEKPARRWINKLGKKPAA